MIHRTNKSQGMFAEGESVEEKESIRAGQR